MLESRQLGSAVLGSDDRTSTTVINSVFLGLAWLTVLLRVYTRIVLVRIFYLEDWLMVISAVCHFEAEHASNN
jgi:hypothetical protein